MEREKAAFDFRLGRYSNGHAGLLRRDGPEEERPVESTRLIVNVLNQGAVLTFVHFSIGEKSGAAMLAGVNLGTTR